jgi:hypothetical protein
MREMARDRGDSASEAYNERLAVELSAVADHLEGKGDTQGLSAESRGKLVQQYQYAAAALKRDELPGPDTEEAWTELTTAASCIQEGGQ